MVKKKVTIEDLAMMVKNGFDHTASKEELGEFRQEANERFKKVDTQLGRIENILFAAHDRRIDNLEDRVRQVLTALKIK
ncbi:MAG: hypothetical protein AAB645_00295 [Patescibacteria group bacterium]